MTSDPIRRKRALVISGGGSKGAFAGGVAEFLINDLERDYDILVGSSTGALLIPQLAIGNIAPVKNSYTSITMEDIYSINPFKVTERKDGSIKTSINHFNVLKMFLSGKKTFGESEKLKDVIKQTFQEEDYELVKDSGKQVIVTVSNLTTDTLEYKYLADYNYEDFVNWLWASTCWVPFMSMAEINGHEYVDGGFGNFIPVEEAVVNGAKDIDVIVLRPRNHIKHHNSTKNAFEVIGQSMWFMLDQIVKTDILIGQYQSIFDNDVKVNFIFTPYELTNYSYYFDPEAMQKWWQLGYDHAAGLNWDTP